MSTFDSTKHSLPDVLNNIMSGQIQLPEFQRGWIWDDAHVRSLLASIARSLISDAMGKKTDLNMSISWLSADQLLASPESVPAVEFQWVLGR